MLLCACNEIHCYSDILCYFEWRETVDISIEGRSVMYSLKLWAENFNCLCQSSVYFPCTIAYKFSTEVLQTNLFITTFCRLFRQELRYIFAPFWVFRICHDECTVLLQLVFYDICNPKWCLECQKLLIVFSIWTAWTRI